MKKYIFIILLIISVLFLFYKVFSDRTDRVFHKDLVFFTEDEICYLKSNQKPINGLLTSSHGDIGNYKKGKREGHHVDYHDNGYTKLEGNFKNGKREGKYVEYHESGNKRLTGNFKNGEHYNGKLTIYYDHFNRIMRQSNKVNGVLNGMNRYYNKYGMLESEEEYDMGEIQYRKTKDGSRTKSFENYKNGKLHGECYYKEFPVYGKLFSLEGHTDTYNYKDGVIDGLYTRTHYNKNKMWEWVYDNGEVVSKTCWDEDGNEINCK